jgi:hypothetical protein
VKTVGNTRIRAAGCMGPVCRDEISAREVLLRRLWDEIALVGLCFDWSLVMMT